MTESLRAGDVFNQNPAFRKATYAFIAALAKVIKKEGEAAAREWVKVDSGGGNPVKMEKALEDHIRSAMVKSSDGDPHAIAALVASTMFIG